MRKRRLAIAVSRDLGAHLVVKAIKVIGLNLRNHSFPPNGKGKLVGEEGKGGREEEEEEEEEK